MPTPGFIPSGDQFYATIRRPGLEDVMLDDVGNKLKFPSAAAAVLHAKKAIDQITRLPVSAPSVDEDEALRRQWKIDQAEVLRKEREAFDMRNVQVVSRKRRFAR